MELKFARSARSRPLGTPELPFRPVDLVSGRSVAHGRFREVLDGVLDGERAGHEELLTLFESRGPEVVAVAEVADELRRRRVGDDVTWVANRNINYTNVCTYKCRFLRFLQGTVVVESPRHALPLGDRRDRRQGS
ncbi:MAG: hypothetical protein CM1200mP26_11940 [Acidimicrobiales bacterium]|nr:MAG: hypothetical protein CM1200mP26_11940 [Acidimicrobiales bacterium]